MENTKRVWLLGAADPEMVAIESLLRESGETVQYATVDNRRVHPGNAYRAELPELPEGATGYAVECVDVLPDGWVRIDHHRPGDPGYGRHPIEYWEASSLGQVASVLGYGGISDLLLIAAADHCLAAAYQEECPGVDPDELMRWRAESRAAFQKRPVSEVLADVEAARAALRSAESVWLSGCPECGGRGYSTGCEPGSGYESDSCHGGPWGASVRDLRGQSVPELPEAACREGVAVLASTQDRDGREKIVLMGDCPPATVRAFLEVWAPRQGLVDTYGDPARGFAGGYLPGGGS